MIAGTHPLERVLDLARARPRELEAAFGFPVLLVVTEDDDQEGKTAVTSPGAPRKTPIRKEPVTLVVPIQPRYPKAGALRLSFGRSSACDLIIPCASVSKHHGYFEFLAGAWSVEDAGSTNGTTINGQPVSKGSTPLTDGCALQLGRVSARFLSATAFCEVLSQRLRLP